MISRRRTAVVAVAALTLFSAGALLASCGGDDGDASATTETPTSSSQTVTATQTTTTETTTTPPPQPTVVRVVVVNGAPKGGIVRETVDKGDRVVLLVESDVSDHVHLHGYDIMRDVAPGRSTRLRFTATIPGRFEVELEDRGVQIADITVQP